MYRIEHVEKFEQKLTFVYRYGIIHKSTYDNNYYGNNIFDLYFDIFLHSRKMYYSGINKQKLYMFIWIYNKGNRNNIIYQSLNGF